MKILSERKFSKTINYGQKHFSAKRDGFSWRKAVQNKPNDCPIQTESGQMQYQMNEINFLFSLAWAKGGIDVGDPMLKIEKCCEGVRALPTPHKSPTP